MERYVAVIIDIIESRHIDDRKRAQELMHLCISFLNIQYKKYLVKDVVVSAGDEFQGLFNELSAAIDYIRILQLLIYPLTIRCGIGVGSIKYDIEDWSSLDIDGECYYNARYAIEDCEKEYQIKVKGTNDDQCFNILFTHISNLKSKQTSITLFIELLIEIITPLNNEGFSLAPMDQAIELISIVNQNYINKEAYRSLKSKNSKISKYKKQYDYLDFESIKYYIYNPIPSLINRTKASCEVKLGRGAINIISEIMDVSSQNVSAIIKKGSIDLERNTWGFLEERAKGQNV